MTFGDERISRSPLLTGAAAAANDLVPVIDVSASLNKRMTLAGLGEAVFRFAPDGSLNLSLIDQNSTTKLGGTVLQVGTVPADRLVPNSITAEQIGPNAVGASELADGAVDTPALQNEAVTGAKLAPGAVAASHLAAAAVTAPALAPQAVGYDKLRNTQAGNVLLGRASNNPGAISEIPCTAAGRQLLAAANATAQRAAMGLGPLATAQGDWADGSSFSGSSSGTNTGDQVITLVGAITGTGTGLIETTLAPGSIAAGLLAPGSVNQEAMGEAAITAPAMADNSTTIVNDETPTGSGAFVGQEWYSPSTSRHWVWTGLAWLQTSGLTSLSFAPSPTIAAEVEYLDPFTASISLSIPEQAPGAVLVGPESGGNAAPAFRRLAGADLPAATALVRGAVQLGEGLQADPAGLASLAPATPLLRGGVSIPAGGLTVSPEGALTHSNSPLTPGTYTKLTIDQLGHAVAAGSLAPQDIPSLDASILGSGSISPERFAAKSILRQALADNSIGFIQEADPGTQENPHRGCLWLRESTGQLRMWNSNSWLPIGFGRLAEENLRYCGTFDANTGTITTLTLFGVGEGFVVGQAVPAATDPRAGVYLVCDTAGDSVGVLPAIAFDPGDWILCNGSTGWVRIDSALGGGSGGATNLDDLLDVAAATPAAGDLLGRSSGGVWVNVKPGTTYLAVAAGQSPETGQLGAEQILVSNTNADPALFIKRANGTVARIAGAGAIGLPGAASTSTAGLLQLATNAQALAGTSTSLAVVPAALAHVLDNRPATTAGTGLIRLATPEQAAAGLDAALAITPATLAPLLAAKAPAGAASTSTAGLIELATPEEAAAGLDATRAITPATLAPLLSATGSAPASTSVLGLVRLATSTDVNDGTSDLLAVTPATLQARTATTSRAGLVTLANQTQVNGGTDSTRAVTAATLQGRLSALFGNSSSYVKGALLAGASSGALGVLAPAANGLFLQTDATAPLGVRWTAAPGGVSSVSGTGAVAVASGTTTPVISVAAATTIAPGVVQLNTSTGSTSTSQAATPSAVKAAFDLASAALPAAGGTITGSVANTATGYFSVAVGTTSQRPSTPGPGMIRYNSTLGGIEWWLSGGWQSSTTLAGLDSPAFTGTPSAPTAAAGTNSSQLATTAFVAAAVAAVSGGGGAATTANRLTTPRNIWGVPFDGSASIGGQLSDVTNIVGRSAENVNIYPATSGRSVTLAAFGTGTVNLNTDLFGAVNLRTGYLRLDAAQGVQVVKRNASSGDRHVVIDVSQITDNRTLRLADGLTVLVAGTMVPADRSLAAGGGLTGGGNLAANRIIALGAGSDITNTSTNSVSGTTHTHRIDGSALVASFAGSIGSYALAKYEAPFGSASVNTNETTPGSNLRWSAGNGSGLWVNNTISLSGTWRLMSRSVVAQADHGLWQRIS